MGKLLPSTHHHAVHLSVGASLRASSFMFSDIMGSRWEKLLCRALRGLLLVRNYNLLFSGWGLPRSRHHHGVSSSSASSSSVSVGGSRAHVSIGLDKTCRRTYACVRRWLHRQSLPRYFFPTLLVRRRPFRRKRQQYDAQCQPVPCCCCYLLFVAWGK